MNKPHIYKKYYSVGYFWCVSIMPVKGKRTEADYARWNRAYEFIIRLNNRRDESDSTC